MATDTQAHILHVSVGLFANKGFDGVSIREIAKAVGATLATIYHHYIDKQALYDAAVCHSVAYMTESMIAAAKSDETGERRLRSFLTSLVTFQMSNSPEVRLVDRELVEGRPEARAMLNEDFFRRPHRMLTQILSEIAPRTSVHNTAEQIIAAAFGAAKLRAMSIRLGNTGHLQEVPDIVDGLAALTLAALRALEADAPSAAGPRSVAR